MTFTMTFSMSVAIAFLMSSIVTGIESPAYFGTRQRAAFPPLSRRRSPGAGRSLLRSSVNTFAEVAPFRLIRFD